MPSVEGKENVDGQILPTLQSTAGGGNTTVPAKQSSGGVGPRSGSRKPSRKPSHRIAALACNSARPNLQAGVVRAPSASSSSAAASAAAAARCPAADSAQQSPVPTPTAKSGKKQARRSGWVGSAPPSSKETTDESPSASSVASVKPWDPKQSGGSGAATAAVATAGLDKKRKSRRGGPVLSSPVPLPCVTPSNNGRQKASKKRNLTTRDAARGQEGKAPQRRGVGGKNRRGKGKGRGTIKKPSTVTSKPSSPPSQGRSHFDFNLDDGGSDVSTPAPYSSEEAASAAGEGPQATAQGGNKKHKLSSVPARASQPPPAAVAVAVAAKKTSQVWPAVARQAASPNQSAGSQSPRGSWHLGALFGESEDDEEEEARETGLWRLSDDDGEEPDVREEESPGRGARKRRRASGSSVGGRGGAGREGGRGLSVGSVGPGGKASRGKRVRGGGTPRKKRAATAAAAAGGGGGGGSRSGGGGSLGGERDSVAAGESDIACAAPLLKSPDKAAAKRGGAHPGDHPKRQSRGEKQEQQEELEAKKELETLLAQFKRVDSHHLRLSR